MDGFLRKMEIGTAMLQGKGAGSGWDLGSEIRAAARCIARANPVLLDVGANRGEWSTGMVGLFPKTQKVILFEPQDDCVAGLEMLPLPEREVIHGAVGDKPGTHAFFLGAPGWAAASFYRRDETFFADVKQRQITVPVVTLDDVFESRGIEFADFVKFDIEGAEWLALKGASEAFERRAIGAMSFEFGSGNINSRTFFRDFWELLTGYGFEVFRVLPSGGTVRIPDYYEDLEYFRGVSNYVAPLPMGTIRELAAR
jgi:FkbM family methyltransferase